MDAYSSARSADFQSAADQSSVALMEFRLPDRPGAITAALELIAEFGLNISFMSSHADGSGYQRFRMGLLVNGGGVPDEFMRRANAILSRARAGRRQRRARNYDTAAYSSSSFVSGLAGRMGLAADKRDELDD